MQMFDVGEADGRDYIAFELVEGRTLQERIAEHQLTLTDLIELAVPLDPRLDALAGNVEFAKLRKRTEAR